MAYITNEQLEGKTFSERLKLLSPQEREYFNKMRPQYGVLYIKGKPGIGKTAILENMARVLGFQYMDIRLTIKDETDVGVFPTISEVKITLDDSLIYNSNDDVDFNNVKDIKVLEYVVPKWAIIANTRPTIVVFEELNRATLAVRNAALQILLERRIDVEFKFNTNVYFAATGNLGEEDGTDVEEFDSALNNRLIHEVHDLTAEEWIENFANDKIHPTIVSFIKANPDYMYRKVNDSNGTEAEKYATPRSWNMLSEYLLCNSDYTKEEIIKGKKYNVHEIHRIVYNEAHKYIGASNAQKFQKYLDSVINISIHDIFNNFFERKADFKKIANDRQAELCSQILEYNMTTLKPDQITNLLGFLKTLNEELRFSFLQQIIDDKGTEKPIRRGLEMSDYPFKDILNSERALLTKMMELSKHI